jgi:hypothetical protein
LNDVYQDDYKRDYQEYMDEAAECIGRDHSQQPENQQNYEDCPEHFLSLSSGVCRRLCYRQFEDPSAVFDHLGQG